MVRATCDRVRERADYAKIAGISFAQILAARGGDEQGAATLGERLPGPSRSPTRRGDPWERHSRRPWRLPRSRDGRHRNRTPTVSSAVAKERGIVAHETEHGLDTDRLDVVGAHLVDRSLLEGTVLCRACHAVPPRSHAGPGRKGPLSGRLRQDRRGSGAAAAWLESEHFLKPSIEVGSANLHAIHSAANIVAAHARDSRRRAGLRHLMGFTRMASRSLSIREPR